MGHSSPFGTIKSRPRVFGTGLLSLDVVIGSEEPSAFQVFVGGTCGNVLTILSYLGWESIPVARVEHEATWKLMKKDFFKWGVNTELANLPPTTPAPIIVQHIKRGSDGRPTHRFSWNCPECGAWLPRFTPVPAKVVEQVLPRVSRAAVCFIDRVSPGALVLARHAHAEGALVVFEPTGVGEPKLFREILNYAHVLKFPEQRRGQFKTARQLVPLEIETKGQSGLLYRFRSLNSRVDGKWIPLEALSASHFVDAAGAGDWCTAGIIHLIGQQGQMGFRKQKQADLNRAIRFGQALAAWNCQFEGARGGMYKATRTEFQSAVEKILSGTHSGDVSETSDKRALLKLFKAICASCKG